MMICCVFVIYVLTTGFGIHAIDVQPAKPYESSMSPCGNNSEPIYQLSEWFDPPASKFTVYEKQITVVQYSVNMSIDVGVYNWPSLFPTLEDVDSRISSVMIPYSPPLITFQDIQDCVALHQKRRVVEVSGSFNLSSHRLGMGGAKLLLNDSTVLFKYPLIVLRPRDLPQVLFINILVILVILLTFTMGAALDYKTIGNYCKRPVAPALGILSQYGFMPLTAFFLSKVLPIDSLSGIGLLTVGCSPGGGASNMWSVLLQGDLNLSMTMTFFSSVLAFGMMPFWIFALGRFYLESDIQVPYLVIGRDLLVIIIPVLCGIAVKWKRERWAQILCRTTKPLSGIFLLFVFTFGTYANWYIFEEIANKPILLVAGALLPWIGFCLGFLFALATRQTWPQCITISLETGIQNTGIAIFLLMNSMPQPYGDIGAVIPVVVSIFTPIPLTIVLIAGKIYRRIKESKSQENEDSGYAPINA
jgi:solute carrier family 10 (sodium/bile acid cotransporter), member 3/5